MFIGLAPKEIGKDGVADLYEAVAAVPWNNHVRVLERVERSEFERVRKLISFRSDVTRS